MTLEEMYKNATQSQADLSQFITTEDGIKKNGILMVDPEDDMTFQEISTRIKLLADKYHMSFQEAASALIAGRLEELDENVENLPHNIAITLKKHGLL